MDPAAKQATRERIAALRAAGTTILLTTHELGDVERLADRVAVLDRGRIVAEGTPAELTGAGAPRAPLPAVDRALDAAEAAALAAALGARAPRSSPSGRGSVVRGPRARRRRPTRSLVAALAAWCEARGLLLTELRLGAASLEERYLELVGQRGASTDRRPGPDA